MEVHASIRAGATSRVDMEFVDRDVARQVFFATSDAPMSAPGDAMVAAGLLPAMKSGAAFRVHADISAAFARRIGVIQDIYAGWDSSLRTLPVEGTGTATRSPAVNGRVGAFFSGGVDSLYTLLKHQTEITDIILIHGFDIVLDNQVMREATSRMVQDVARSFGKHAIEIETDLKTFLDAYCHWGMSHGSLLACIGHLLRDTLSRIYIPSSYTYRDLFPWGSHPLLDPLWSSEGLEFVHDGCEASRVDKMELIARSDVALRSIRVCWTNPRGQYNCGRCEKCLRTMINLHAVGALDRCTTFSTPFRVGRVLDLSITQKGERIYMMENLAGLEKRGLDPELQRVLRRLLTRPAFVNRTRQALRRLTHRYPSVLEPLRGMS